MSVERPRPVGYVTRTTGRLSSVPAEDESAELREFHERVVAAIEGS